MSKTPFMDIPPGLIRPAGTDIDPADPAGEPIVPASKPSMPAPERPAVDSPSDAELPAAEN